MARQLSICHCRYSNYHELWIVRMICSYSWSSDLNSISDIYCERNNSERVVTVLTIYTCTHCYTNCTTKCTSFSGEQVSWKMCQMMFFISLELYRTKWLLLYLCFFTQMCECIFWCLYILVLCLCWNVKHCCCKCAKR